MGKTAKEILQSIIDDKQISVRSFANRYGIGSDALYFILNERTANFSVDMMTKLMEKVHVRREYLKTGEGEMYQSEIYSCPVSQDGLGTSYMNLVAKYNDLIRSQQERIDAQEAFIKELREKLSVQNRMLNIYERRLEASGQLVVEPIEQEKTE